MRTALIFVAISVSAASQSGPALSTAQWREDVAHLARELPRRHANAFHVLSRDAFETAVAALQSDLAQLQPHQIAVRLLQITAQVGDGHTYVRLPQSFHVLPIGFTFFESTLRVAAVTPDTRDLFGAEVTAIEGKPIADVMARVRTLLSRGENKWFELANAPGYLALTEVLHALGVTSAPGKADITFRIAGSDVSRTLAGQPRQALQFVPQDGPLPLYRQRPAERFWFTSLPGSPAGVYVAFRGYDDFAKNARALLAHLDAERPRFVAFDLRANGGGDFTKPRDHLLPMLQRRGYTGSRVYVITGRRTFSAAMVNAIDFRTVLQATLVGEPPGERPNSYQENDDMQLPHSKLLVSYSTKYDKFLPEDVPAVMPDQSIEPTWEAFESRRDPALEWILQRVTQP